MPVLDLFKKPFSEETITKLDIFEKYLEAWLPVFIHHPSYHEVNICDFFAGMGQDKNMIPGSPLRILKVIKSYQDSILKKGLYINIHLNEYDKKKLKYLKELVDENREEFKEIEQLIHIELYNHDFKELFDEKKAVLQESVNLVFLDQNGIKQVSEEVFTELESFPITDFLFFISSSFFKRFSKAFSEYFPSLDHRKIKKANPVEIHRVILEEYKKMLPSNSKTVLYPFSIKKGANIYGLIFGSKHLLAVDKFLHIAWDKNKLNGQANFDIDEDIKKQQRDLFSHNLTKIEEFQENLEKMILESESISNKDIYDFTIGKGHIPKHAVESVRKLKHENRITFSGHPRINYKSCYKEKNIIVYRVIQ